MVSLMRDWLKPMIEGELELAIEWKRATAGPNKSADADNGPTSSGRKLNRQALAKIYEDDSSNLRAKIERTRLESSVVQVVEFLTTTKPIRAILADGYTSIHAKFKGAAVQTFIENRGEQFPKGKNGCVMNIPKFEIVATPLGVKNQRVSLLIDEFDVLGSSGSPTFGHPKPIEISNCVISLVEELLVLNNGRAVEAADAGSDGNSLDTRQSEAVSENDKAHYSTLMTQAPLASQLVPLRRPLRSPDVKLLRGVNLAGPVQARRSIGTKLKGTSAPNSLNTMEANLMAVLGQRDQQNNHGVQVRRDEQLDVIRTVEIAYDNNRVGNIGTSKADDSKEIVTLEDPDPEPGSDAPNSTTSPRENAGNGPLAGQDYLRVASSDGDEQGLKADRDTPDEEVVEGVEIVTTIMEPALKRTSPTRDPINREPARQGNSLRSALDVWQDVRITRRLCQIPLDQRVILEKDESWLPAHPGKKFPSPNIPIKILQQLNRAVESRDTPAGSLTRSNKAATAASRKVRSRERSSSCSAKGNGPETGSQSKAGSVTTSDPLPQPEEPPKSSAPLPWSPSPDPDRLPVDSSAPEPDHDEQMSSGEAVASDIEVTRLPGYDKLEDNGSGQPRVSRTGEDVGSTTESGRPAVGGRSPHLVDLSSSRCDGSRDEGEKAPQANETHKKPRVTIDSDESDIEMSVPHALGEELVQPNLGVSPTQRLSTALQQTSRLQVKQTPYHSTRRACDFLKLPSSAPVIPSTIRTLSRDKTRALSQNVHLDNANETVNHRYDHEDIIDRQIQDELDVVCDHKSAAHADHESAFEPKTHLDRQGMPQHSSPEREKISRASSMLVDQKSITSTPNCMKREADSKALPHQLPKKRRVSPPDFGFSQEGPVSQDPALKVRKTRREFIRSVSRSEQLEGSAGPLPEGMGNLDSGTTHPSSDNVEIFDAMESQSDPPADTKVTTGEIAGLEQSGSMKLGFNSVAHRTPSPNDPPDASPVDQTSIYARFLAAYPDYGGNVKHFLGLCRMIDRLQKAEKMQHRSLWDDFIIRHRTDYQQYLLRCSAEGEDPVAYEKFYRDEIDEPIHSKRIMNPTTLKLALEQGTRSVLSVASEPPAVHAPPADASSTRSSDAAPQSASIPPAEARQADHKRAIRAPPPGEPAAKRPPPSNRPAPESHRPMLDSYRPDYSKQEPRHRKEIRHPKPASPPPSSRETIDLSLVSSAASSPPTSTLPPPGAASPADRPARRLPWGAPQAPAASGKPPRTPRPAAHETHAAAPPHQAPRPPAAGSAREAEVRQRRGESGEGEWWRDARTPFREFACAFVRLKGVEGIMGTVEDGVVRPPVGRVDVLRWEL